jgi:hypothetical protein
MDDLLVALMPLTRRVSFLLGGVVPSSMLRGDLEIECLLEDVVEDGVDDDDPFLLVKRFVVFFHMVAALFSQKNSGFQPVTRHFKNYFEMWTSRGLRV